MLKWLFGLICTTMIAIVIMLSPYFSGLATEAAVLKYIDAANCLHPEILFVNTKSYKRHFSHSDATLAVTIPSLQQQFDIKLKITHGPVIALDGSWRFALSKVEVSMPTLSQEYQALTPTLIVGLHNQIALLTKREDTTSEINIEHLLASREPGYDYPQLITYNIEHLTSIDLNKSRSMISHRESNGVTLTSESEITDDNLLIGNWELIVDHNSNGAEIVSTKLNTETFDSQYLLENHLAGSQFHLKSIMKHRRLKINEVPEIDGPLSFRLQVKDIDRELELTVRNALKSALHRKRKSLTETAAPLWIKQLIQHPIQAKMHFNWKTKNGSLKVYAHIQTPNKDLNQNSLSEFIKKSQISLNIETNKGFIRDAHKLYKYLTVNCQAVDDLTTTFKLCPFTLQEVEDSLSNSIQAGYVKQTKDEYHASIHLHNDTITDNRQIENKH